MSYWAKYDNQTLLDQEMVQSEKSGAFCRTFDIYERVLNTISKLDEQDGEGHIWWNKFKELLEEYEPSLIKQHSESDDLPY